MSSTLLVTGANGFIGEVLCKSLVASGHEVRRAVRGIEPGVANSIAVGAIGTNTDWRPALRGVNCVIHLAARAHVLRETAVDPVSEYRRTNVEGTRHLAISAARQGVRRFLLMSSVKVNGERTERPFTEDDVPSPDDAYGVSKWDAEQWACRIGAETGMEVVALRPPLVYGPGVRGNFLRLMDIVARGVPLPLASVTNRRSLIYVGNLVDAVIKAIDAQRVVRGTYLVSDGEDVSTPDLLRAIAGEIGVKSRLLPCPPALLNFTAALLGKRGEMARLTGSLQLDCSKIQRDLGWRPPFSFRFGLAETARQYRQQISGNR